MARRESAFILENDPELILPLLKLLHEEIEGLNICDQCGQLQVGVALQEALYNALFHGNLEVSSELRQEDERLFEAVVGGAPRTGALLPAADPGAGAARPRRGPVRRRRRRPGIRHVDLRPAASSPKT